MIFGICELVILGIELVMIVVVVLVVFGREGVLKVVIVLVVWEEVSGDCGYVVSDFFGVSGSEDVSYCFSGFWERESEDEGFCCSFWERVREDFGFCFSDDGEEGCCCCSGLWVRVSEDCCSIRGLDLIFF